MSAKSEEAPRVKLEAVMVTDVGVVRDHNEDSAHVDPDGTFFIVADGMGGHAAGEVASAMAVETVKTTLEKARTQILSFAKRPTEQGRRDLVGLLQGSVLAAHQAVFQRGSKETDKQGMGTTLDVVMVAGNEAFIAHVGDSRTYLVREGRASQITTDHTVAEVLVIEGKLSIEEAQVSPLRTILVNAIGVSADVGVEMAHLQLKRDDRILVCSDGLHDYFLAEEEIAERLVPPQDQALEPALRDMVEIAKERGGHDNITGIAVRVMDLPDAVPTAIEPDETQPVDSKGTKAPEPGTSAEGWSDDEHTETTSAADLDIENAPTLPPQIRPGASANKQTQPLRAVKLGQVSAGFAGAGTATVTGDGEKRRDLGRADTVPPPEEKDAPSAGSDGEKKPDEKKDKADKADKAEAKPEKKGKVRKGKGTKQPKDAAADDGDDKKPDGDGDGDETTSEHPPGDDK
jgi:serine/threonine protein phosphatase PrpC